MEGGFFFGLGGGVGGVVGHSEESTSPTFECFVVWKEKNNGECKDILLPLYHDVNGLVRTKQIS